MLGFKRFLDGTQGYHVMNQVLLVGVFKARMILTSFGWLAGALNHGALLSQSLQGSGFLFCSQMSILLKADMDSCDGAFGRSLRLTADYSDTRRGEVTATRFPKLLTISPNSSYRAELQECTNT